MRTVPTQPLPAAATKENTAENTLAAFFLIRPQAKQPSAESGRDEPHLLYQGRTPWAFLQAKGLVMPMAKASWGPQQVLDLETFPCFDVKVSHPVSDTRDLSSLSFSVKRGLQTLSTLMLLVPMRHLIGEGLE